MSHNNKILIVDDSDSSRALLINVLKPLNVGIFEADCCKEAVYMTLQEDFDLILMKVKMQIIDGFQTAKLIRQKKKNRFIPILFQTAKYFSEQSFFKSIEGIEGVVDYVKQSVSPFILTSKVKQLLQFQFHNEQLEQLARDLKVSTEKLNKLQLYDHLNGIFNRKIFLNLLIKSISRAKREKEQLAVLFLSVDNLNQIIEQYGDSVVDKILVIAAKKIKNNVRDSDNIGIGGGEFVICLDNIKSVSDIILVVDKINNSFSEKIKFKEGLFDLTISIGISIYPSDGKNSNDLLKKSHIALQKANQVQVNNFQFINEKFTKEMLFERALESAIEKNEFKLRYLPIVDKTQKPYLAEALIRWSSPEFGCVKPMDFIPILERNKGIIKVGEWIFQESCKQLNILEDNEQYRDVLISVNISHQQLDDDYFIDKVKRIIKETKANPGKIMFEISERQEFKNVEKIADTLRQLKQIGIAFIALDNFGIGYSSFLNLIRLPIDIVKIDKYFIDKFSTNKTKKIIRDLIALIKNYNYQIVVQGIETEDQFELLQNMGSDFFQGFYFSKPVPSIYDTIEVKHWMVDGVGEWMNK